jgi:quercetin dioxygenase-like cupin family protein
MHRTETLVYTILLSGEYDLQPDAGKTLHLTQGDVVVQRGTMHAWINNVSQPCMSASVPIDAEPAEAGSQSPLPRYTLPERG